MLHALRVRYPDASISVLSRYNVMEIYQDNPDLDHLELFNIEEYTRRLMSAPQNIFDAYIELREAVDHLKAMNFDMVINVTHDRFSTFLTHLITSSRIKGMYLSPNKKLHIKINGLWFQYLRCTSNFRMVASFNLADIYKNAVGGSIETQRLFFHISKDSISKADTLLGPTIKDAESFRYIGFQLGTSTGNRRWPSEYFIELGNRLQNEMNTKIVLLGSKDEKKIGEKVIEGMTEKPIDLIGETNISVLASILNRCALLVTNDTGTMHLAAAVGTPCIALFFESANPFQTGPYGEGHIICSPDLDCFPCPTTFECNDKRCLHRIPVETVYRLIQDRLGKNPSFQIPQPIGMRMFKTRFDPLGVWDAWPVGRLNLKKKDIIRRLYRHMWLRFACRSREWNVGSTEPVLQDELKNDLRQWSQNYFLKDPEIQKWLSDFQEGLETLTGIVDRGLGLIKAMVLSIQNVSLAPAYIKKQSDILGVLEKKIIQSGQDDLFVGQLTNLFQLELEQIHDAPFLIMLNAWKQVYDNLGTRMRILEEEIRLMREALGC